jgi:hypothetical protein
MGKNSISLEVKLGEVEYRDENTINIPIFLKQKGSNDNYSMFSKMLKFNGQVWQTVDKESITTDDDKEVSIEDQIKQLENDITNSKIALETTKYSDLKIQKLYENMMNKVIKRNINKLNELKGRI